MKVASIVAKKGKLPEAPLEMQDLPNRLPKISQGELLAYVNAKQCYQIAQADYEKKRANITLRLLQLCESAPGDISVSLQEDGDRLVVVHTDANAD